MSIHRIEFEYTIPEWSSIDMEIEDALDHKEAEEIALAEIKDQYPDVSNIEITLIKAV